MINKHITALLIVISVVHIVSSQVRFTATTQRTHIAMGEQALITAQLVTGKNPGSIAAPAVASNEMFTVLRTDQRQSSNSSIQIINGQASQKTEIIFNFLYIITPKSSGSFTFPSLEVEVSGSRYQTEPIQFTVSNEQIKNSDLKAILQLNKKSMYIGEQLILTFKLAQRAAASVDIRNSFSPALAKIEQAFGGSFALTRLFTNQVSSTSEMIDGEAYTVYFLQYAAVPLNAGKITVPSIPVEYNELQQSRRRRMDPFFDDFFSSDFFGGGVEAIGKTVMSNSLTVDVKSLPTPSPSGFSGSVGKFSLTAEVSPLTTPAGESVTLKIGLRGNTRPGSIGELTLPKMDECEIFKPERQVFADTNHKTGISTHQSYKYLLIPRQQGSLTIPSIEYNYFDPESGSYKTTSSQPISIVVTAGKEGAKPQTRYLTQEEIREVGQDIRYIKTGVKIKNQSRFPHRNPVFIVVLPLPFILFIFSVLYSVQASKKERNAERNTRKKASTLAHRKLAQLRKQGTSLPAPQFLGKTAEILEHFISEKFGFSSTGRTLDELKAELQTRTTSQETITDLASFMEMLDSYRFGGMTFNDSSRNTIIEKAGVFLSKIEKNSIKERKSS
ncbi:MAG TPA: BatD family protein [Chitinispirillaceae bacterium]|nr:BatD family protein [Chitinispirillaceae bacterium]